MIIIFDEGSEVIGSLITFFAIQPYPADKSHKVAASVRVLTNLLSDILLHHKKILIHCVGGQTRTVPQVKILTQKVIFDVKGVARRRTLFQKITCSQLKLCSGKIEELKERVGRGRNGC